MSSFYSGISLHILYSIVYSLGILYSFFWTERKRVYTDIESLLFAELGDGYQMVDTEEEADILWTAGHVKDFSNFQQFQQISQFPNEWLLTTKVPQFMRRTLVTWYDHRWPMMTSFQIGLMESAKRCRKANQQHPDWFAPTYDLRSEVSHFVAHYEGIDILWPHFTPFDLYWCRF